MSLPSEKVVAIHLALDVAGHRHAFGGAIALAFCTKIVRATQDIDVNVFLSPSDAKTVFGALPSGVTWDRDDVRTAERDGQVRLKWDDTPVDLFFAYHPFHEHAARRARQVVLLDVPIPVLECSDLAVFKGFFGRTQDYADLESMAAADALDDGEVLQWMGDLLGTDDPLYEQVAAAIAKGRAQPSAEGVPDAVRRALGTPKSRPRRRRT